MTQTPEQREKAQSQFDELPYPNLPLAQAPGNHPVYLAAHSCVIPYYLRYHRVIDPHGKWILDAGCGSGFKAMALAFANPGAHIVGIDVSPQSIDLAKQRIEYHGIKSPIEFHCLPVEDLPNLGYTFDYINCDETLYLLPDPAAGLRAMRSVLKPEGILRANLHSVFQRADCYRVQALFQQLGCLEGAITRDEIELVRQTMGSLQDWVVTKQKLWNQNPELKTDPEKVMANFLLRGDKGYTIKEFSALLRQAELEFISMVNWREWNLESLFKRIEDLPISVALGLADMTLEEQLHIYELLHPVHRLLDLYCGHPNQGQERPALEDWGAEQWQAAVVHLHPQLRTQEFKAILEAGVSRLGMVALDKHFPINGQPFKLDSSLASCLHPLIEKPSGVIELCDRWMKIRPVNPITLEPTSPGQVFATVRSALIKLEAAGYVMVELPAE
jgi:ubiquinone/menaquinone biosynthesis C-methylase UbiE